MITVLPEIQRLLADDRRYVLGPGSPNVAVRAQLQQLARELPTKAKDLAFATACLAGLWLYHDFLDESHTISQDLGTVEGSYWHALMHRREPDYGNAKYWFRQVSGYPIFGDLNIKAAALAEQAGVPSGCEFLARQKAWDPPAFVDLCEAAARDPDRLDGLCRRIQSCEWALLFQYCHERAFYNLPAPSEPRS